MEVNKPQVNHFIVLVAISLVSAFFLDFGGALSKEMNLIQYLMVAYLLVALAPTLFLALSVWFVFSILGVKGLPLDALYWGSIVFFGIINLWKIAGYYSTPKSKRRKMRWGWVLPFIVLLVILLIIWQLGVFGKPAIYMYPEEDMDVKVQVDLNGWITESSPEYGSGWGVHVNRGGRIDGGYDYLYYEAALYGYERPAQGWIVEYGDLDDWFDVYLPLMGLNDAETAEFKDYWAGRLPESKYCQIGLISDEFLSRDMRLIVDPEPDTEIRLIFYFKPLDEKIEIQEPEITKKKREGFTVVEWGGVIDMNILDWAILHLENLNLKEKA